MSYGAMAAPLLGQGDRLTSVSPVDTCFLPSSIAVAGDIKDIELRSMAKFLAQKVIDTGMDQQMGPLNPYERRMVHMAVAEVPGATTESVGDAFSKTVLISRK